MADKSNTTNATELLNKICSGGTITPQDLGTPTANTQATTYLTEGTTPLHFELNTQNKNKNNFVLNLYSNHITRARKSA